MDKPRYYDCPECGAHLLVFGTRGRTMLDHMINAGEMTVGEAKVELDSRMLTPDEAELLAGWVLSRWDQGDNWKAGDPVRYQDGKVVRYDEEGTPVAALVRTGDETWERRNENAWA